MTRGAHHCLICRTITRATSDAVLARAVPIRAHALLRMIESIDARRRQ